MMARLIALEHAQRENQASLNARNAENSQLEKALKESAGRYEELVAESRTERKELSDRLDSLERQSKTMADRWRAELTDVLGPLKDSSVRVERLLGTFNGGAEPVASGSTANTEQTGSADAGPGQSDAESGEEATWGF
jgi:predicted nuclease with TOPRIM domain